MIIEEDYTYRCTIYRSRLSINIFFHILLLVTMVVSFTFAQVDSNRKVEPFIALANNYQMYAPVSASQEQIDFERTRLSGRTTFTEKHGPSARPARLAVNISLGVLAIAGLTGYIVEDIKCKRLLEESKSINNVFSAMKNETEWENTTATRNLLGTIAGISSAACAISLIIPIGNEDRVDSAGKKVAKLHETGTSTKENAF